MPLVVIAALATLMITFATGGAPKAQANANAVAPCVARTVPDSKAIETYTAKLRASGSTRTQIDKALATKFGLKKAATKTVVSPNSNAYPSDLQEWLSIYTAGGNGCGTPYGYAQFNWHFTNGVNGRVTNECNSASQGWNSCHDAEDIAAITISDNNGGGVYTFSRYATSYGYIMDSNFHWNNTYGNPEPWYFSAGSASNNGVSFPMYTFDHWVDGSEHNPWGSDFSNANGNMGIAFKLLNGDSCKNVTAYGHYDHSWNQTSINSVSVGPWSIGVGWSSSNNHWGTTVDTLGQQYWLCL
ncbi:hypothetical protein AB0N17_46255 [Streptomyces sp. NPDC051133]|uniref:hypothetical protein n=1 Tax=Streptomyces sp. NPDC051133 TaxID=3155521 RepID=UPI003442C9E8